jgi:LPS export ABC transporter protein LptC
MSYLKPRNLLLVLALVLALVLLVVIVFRFRPESQIQTIVKALPEGVDVSLQDIDYTHIENGKSRWRLVANQVARQSGSGVMGLVSPQLEFFDEQGGQKGAVQAGHGEVSDDYLQVKLSDNVVLKNSSGYTLYMEQLHYDHTMQMATTHKPVRLVADGLQLEGVGLVYYVKLGLLRLNQDVNGVFDPKRGK